ncbi:conserved hypothetical protein [Histoplasma capsulatum var. duboisii H88]|uniref:Protein kinase domain-containing protein n=1 Tax=Ajellomyces capsulatus (strain H88) TaxID=544711 RepID=F0UES0_AJEC8|nr:conserved hypothetical protein [Histoplasma capsulatum var. duboisii H88]
MPLYTLFTRGMSYFPSLLPLLPAKPLPLVSCYPGLGRRFSRRYAMSTTSQSHEGPLSLGTRLKGDSGQMYRIEEVLTDRRKPLLCVYRAQYIKANNILVDYDESIQGQTIINNVQISDLEDAVLVPPGKWLRGPLCGNAIWRSPGGWCRSHQNEASDCLQMIYIMLNEMVFRVSDCELYASDSWRYVLQRHISYFADEQGLIGLLKHIGEDNPFHGRLIALAGDFNSGNPRMHFEAWEPVDPEFRDLVGKMTNLDPTRRITARQALEHSWFSQAI